jgi:hypothetical protein
MERETEMEIKYFIKEKKRKRQISTKNGIVNTKVQKKLQNTGHAEREIK